MGGQALAPSVLAGYTRNCLSEALSCSLNARRCSLAVLDCSAASAVLWDSPAFQAGLVNGWEVVAVNDLVDPEMNRTMAEAVLSWVLYLHRDMYSYRVQQGKKAWIALDYIKPSKKVVSFIGLGELGKAAAKKLIENGFKVCGWSGSKKNIKKIKSFTGHFGLKKMLGQTDILVCLIPLTDKTKYLLNYKTLSFLKKGACIVNFARGAIINEKDLVKHLNSGKIKHAVLDVFEQEPLPKKSILWKNKRVTILPHISANTDFDSASDIVAKNLKLFKLKKKIPKSVDLQRGY